MNKLAYNSLSVADALARDWRGWHLSRKMDGVFAVETPPVFNTPILGERMRDGTFYPFEITAPGDCPTRQALLTSCFQDSWKRIPEGNGEEFIRAMVELARADHTPDVCVAKPMDAAWGESLVKIKLVETYDVEVSDADGELNSVAIRYQNRNAGRISVRGPARDSLRTGQIIEIAGTLLASGKFREARFIRARLDKTPVLIS